MKLFFQRTIRDSFQNLRRNKVLSAAIFMVMTIALLVFQLTIATNLITDTAVSLIHRQIDLVVDLQPGAQDFQIQQTISAIKRLSPVRDAVYVSKETALENFRQQHAEIAGFLDEYGIENPLPNTIFILTDSPSSHTSILNFLEQPEYSTIIDTSIANNRIQSRSRTGRLIEVTNAIRQAAFSFTGLLIILSIFTIWNTIRIAMHSRREERNIMTLVGASPAFMRAPYLWEGLWFGLFSALFSTLLFGFISKALSPYIVGYLTSEPMIMTSRWSLFFPGAALNLADFFANNWIALFGLTASIGAFFGVVSAWIATFDRRS